MNSDSHHPDRRDPSESDRLDQLLADRATEGLDVESLGELEFLLRDRSDQDALGWDLAAAALEVEQFHAQSGSRISTDADSSGELPATLRKRIVADGRMRVRSLRAGRHSQPSETEHEASTSATPAVTGLAEVSSARSFALPALGLAATIIFGVTLGFLFSLESSLSPEQSYQRLVAESTDLIRTDWTGLEGAGLEKIAGEVVWSDALQEGYMVLEDVPANDPKVEQYQLWIVDPDRAPQPVDGGVFDVAARPGRQVIPIDPALVIDQPAAFVITLEQAGGVVVSEGPHRAIGSVGG